ncbi:MAG: helix-turn-helix domain-containing protein [Burkholderiaceae bacterium]
MEALGATPVKPAEIIPLGDTALLSMSMSDAARMFGVPHDTISRRRIPNRKDEGQMIIEFSEANEMTSEVEHDERCK